MFAELGFDEASIVAITEVAGAAQGTFYQCFASKQEIFEELVRACTRASGTLQESASRGCDRIEQERLGFRGNFQFTSEHPALYRIIRQAGCVSREMPPACCRARPAEREDARPVTRIGVAATASHLPERWLTAAGALRKSGLTPADVDYLRGIHVKRRCTTRSSVRSASRAPPTSTTRST